MASCAATREASSAGSSLSDCPSPSPESSSEDTPSRGSSGIAHAPDNLLLAPLVFPASQRRPNLMRAPLLLATAALSPPVDQAASQLRLLSACGAPTTRADPCGQND
eukprot:scaffold7647_cov403-Prasinococcus_capsulatus_cf.AAC.6